MRSLLRCVSAPAAVFAEVREPFLPSSVARWDSRRGRRHGAPNRLPGSLPAGVRSLMPVAEARMLWTVPRTWLEARDRVKIVSSASGLRPLACPAAAPASPVRLAHHEPAKKDGDHIRIASPTQPGKAPHKALRPRVCNEIAPPPAPCQDINRLSPVGTLWNSPIAVDCRGKLERIWTADVRLQTSVFFRRPTFDD